MRLFKHKPFRENVSQESVDAHSIELHEMHRDNQPLNNLIIQSIHFDLNINLNIGKYTQASALTIDYSKIDLTINSDIKKHLPQQNNNPFNNLHPHLRQNPVLTHTNMRFFTESRHTFFSQDILIRHDHAARIKVLEKSLKFLPDDLVREIESFDEGFESAKTDYQQEDRVFFGR